MSELRRRAAFWRNLEYDFDHMAEDIEARSSEKWANNNDVDHIEDIKHYLRSALTTARRRYAEVLQAQIREWEEEKELVE